MKTLLILWMLLSMLSSAEATGLEEVAFLATRTAVTQPVFLNYNDAIEPKQVAILFPGGNGFVKITQENNRPRIRSRGNFLVRSRELFVDNGVATIIVDSPSDQQTGNGMSDSFRTSAAHSEDIDAVVHFARERFTGAKIFLVGTSRGTISVAKLGGSLADRIDGVVLTSAVYAQPAFHLPKLSIPALLVHHRNDGCRICPYGSAQKMAQGLNLPLITVTSDNALPYPPYPGADSPCEAYSNHGYYGQEKETVESIVEWMRQQ